MSAKIGDLNMRKNCKALGLMTAMLLFAANLTELTPMPSPTLSVKAADSATVSIPTACGFEELPCDTVYSVMVRLSGKYITQTSDGGLMQYADTKGENQQWLIRDAGNGFCKFCLASNPSMVWTVANGTADDGNAIQLAADTGSSAQRFKLGQADDAYTITAECSLSKSTALDILDISYDDNAKLDQWNYWGGENQKFYIRPYQNTYTYLRGDLDRNGVVNVSDLTMLKHGIFYGADSYIQAIADINGDGTLSPADAKAMTELLCGKSVSGYTKSLKRS